MEAPPEEEFVLRDGKRIASLNGLYEALADISEEDWNHFVTPQKNDFARWIELSLNDRFLAAKVRRTRDRTKLRKALFMTLFR